jgi:hypothetical protein
VIQGDCIEVMREFPDDTFTAIVTDPPYGLEFMGKGWDKVLPPTEVWRECLRVLRPGGHALIFGGTRTYHRLACAVEDAGFEVRDCLMWLYGQGFPKSLDVSKAIDKRPGSEFHGEFKAALAAAREAAGLSRADLSERVVGTRSGACWNWEHHQFPEFKHWPALKSTLPALDEKWGAVLEVADRAFLEEPTGGLRGGSGNTVGCFKGRQTVNTPTSDDARLWSGYGTALKPAWEPILLARKPLIGTVERNCREHGTGALNIDGCRIAGLPPHHNYGRTSSDKAFAGGSDVPFNTPLAGRWPANLILDPEAAALLDAQAHGTSRFFYCAKASKSDRGEGNTHPTVKPVELMRWLVRLVKGPGDNLILDPFAGSGTTGVAAQLEDVPFLLIEREAEYVEIVERRLAEMVK